MCDPAGPGFDVHPSNIEPRAVAIHSQCMHTDSSGYGTSDRCCHQDWILGDCGITQTAAGYNFLLRHAVLILFFIFNFVSFSGQNH